MPSADEREAESRRLSDRVEAAIRLALEQGRDAIAEELMVSHKLILEEDARFAAGRREGEDPRPGDQT